MDATLAIEARGVGRRVHQSWLVEGVDLTVAPGDFLVLLGPNGAGKTTLLNLFAGTNAPSAGTLSLLGQAQQSWSPLELARRRAMLRQGPTATSDLSVLDVVLLGRLPFGDEASFEGAAIELLEQLGVAPLRHRSLNTLSGGEQRRVRLARALAQVQSVPPERSLLLLDEPLAGLDPKRSLDVMVLLRREAERGRAVVAAVHQVELALQYATRCALLRHGRLVKRTSNDEPWPLASLSEVFDLRFERVVGTDGTPHLVTLPSIAVQSQGSGA